MEKIKIKKDGIIKSVKKEVADYLVKNGEAEYTTEKTKDMKGIVTKCYMP